MLLALALELGDLGLLHHDLLAGGGVGERAGLLRGGGRSIDLGLEPGLTDRGVAAGLGLAGVGLLLGFGGGLVGLRLCDARVALDRGSVWTAQVADVAGRIVDLLNLQ